MIVCSPSVGDSTSAPPSADWNQTGILKRSKKKATNDNTQLVFRSKRRTKVNAVHPTIDPRALPPINEEVESHVARSNKINQERPHLLVCRQDRLRALSGN